MKIKEFPLFDKLVGLVGLLLGIPTLLEFFRVRLVNALLLTIIILLVVGYLVFRWMKLEQQKREIKERTLFTYIEVEKTVVFAQGSPQKVNATTTVYAQANHTGLTHLWFRNIASDGTIGNFSIDGSPVPPELIRRKAGSYEVGKEFPHPLRQGETCTVTLSFESTGAFLGNREGITHVVLTETKKLKMRVQFDPSKVGRQVSFFVEIGGGIAEQLSPPRLLNNGNTVEVEENRLQIGAYYTVEWIW